MLKFIYTETALHLELVSVDLDDWVEQRRIFAVATGEKIAISSESATFLLPDEICDLAAMNFYLHCAGVKNVTVYRCDIDRLEVSLSGFWLCTNFDRIEGIFITQLPDRVESYLWHLWYAANDRLVAEDGVMG